MIDPTKFNRIIAYGCSYTAGAELLDHVILGKDVEECDKLKKRLGFDNFYRTFPEITMNHRVNLNASWAAQLAKLLNKDFVNHAVVGTSLDHAYYLLCEDIIKGFITTDDLVLVGLTTPNRLLRFENGIGTPYSFVMTAPININSLSEYKNLLIDFYNDDKLSFEYSKTVFSLHQLSSVINIKLQPMFNFDDIIFNKTILSQRMLSVVSHLINNSKDSILEYSNFLDIDHLPNCGFGHPGYSAHVNLAESLFNTCFLKETSNTT